MKEQKFTSQSGKSLVEIIVILVVIGILTSFAIIQISSSKTYMQRQNLTRELKTYLERARFDAVKRRAEGATTNLSRVIINSATTYSVVTDLNQNGKLETNEERRVDFGSQNGVKFVGTLTYPIIISFDRHGHTTVQDGASQLLTSALFTICDKKCTLLANANTTNSDGVSISPSGTVSILKGGETFTSPLSPNVSVIQSNTFINPQIIVNKSANIN